MTLKICSTPDHDELFMSYGVDRINVRISYILKHRYSPRHRFYQFYERTGVVPMLPSV